VAVLPFSFWEGSMEKRVGVVAEFGYSEAGLALTKEFESLRLSAYKDQRGVWTVGYGHTGADVHEGSTITRAEADALLEGDVAGAAGWVRRLVTGAISQNQFDALVDFTFNLGCGSLEGSTLLKMVNAGDMAGAAREFLVWDHVNGEVVPGLLRRRQAEMALFQA